MGLNIAEFCILVQQRVVGVKDLGSWERKKEELGTCLGKRGNNSLT